MIHSCKTYFLDFLWTLQLYFISSPKVPSTSPARDTRWVWRWQRVGEIIYKNSRWDILNKWKRIWPPYKNSPPPHPEKVREQLLNVFGTPSILWTFWSGNWHHVKTTEVLTWSRNSNNYAVSPYNSSINGQVKRYLNV